MRASISSLFFRHRRADSGANLRVRLLCASVCCAFFAFCGAAQVRAATYTVTNTSDSGNGSLRRAVQNANGSAGADTIAFNVPTASLTGGVAVITLTGGPLVFTDADTTLDGTTQTTNKGDTNPGTLGVGGTVGVDNLFLSRVNRPEVQIVNGTNPATAIGLDLQASGIIVRGISIYGFGTTANNDTSGNIRLGATFTGTLIEQNFVGLSATAANFNNSATATSAGDNVRITGGDNGTIQNNLIGYSNGKGIQLGTGSDGWLVINNEVRSNGINNSNLDGIDMENNSGGDTVRGNLFVNNEAPGVDMYHSRGSNTIENNTITGNGVGAGAGAETPGVRIYGPSNTIRRNIINANFGAGVMVTAYAGTTGDLITQNSIYNNGTITNKGGAGPSGQIGIDLQSGTDAETAGTSPFVTANDSGDGDAGGNDLFNFPVLTYAILSGGNLTLAGYARPGSAIEFFVAAPDPTGFGEGQTYLVKLNEGSASDTDATTGTYTSPVNGLGVGTDNTNRFKFTIAVPGGVAAGTTLTATGTSGTSTSEFAGNVVVRLPPSIALCKTIVGQPCPPAALPNQQPGTDITYSIAFTNTGGLPATNFGITDPDPTTTLKLNDNTDFKVGSVVNTLGTTGLTVVVAYSNDGGATYLYTPTSGGGGAPANYDRLVTHIRWSFTGSLSQTAPNNTGSIAFTVRIR